jgi:hypothetical protein
MKMRATPVIKQHRSNAKLIGAFFIVAAVTSIVGLMQYNPILANPKYLSEGYAHYNQVILGVVFELILVSTMMGTGVMLYPYLKSYNESWGLGYVIFRLLEGIFIVITRCAV